MGSVLEIYRPPEVSNSYPGVRSEGLKTDEHDVFVVVTQAFDGYGNQLVGGDSASFDGFPGVRLFVRLPDGRAGVVTLSPIHGDSRKQGFTDIADGTLCRLRGVEGGPPLDADGPCVCGRGTYHRIYLSPQLEWGETVLICDIWGCHRSRIIDEREMLSWIDY